MFLQLPGTRQYVHLLMMICWMSSAGVFEVRAQEDATATDSENAEAQLLESGSSIVDSEQPPEENRAHWSHFAPVREVSGDTAAPMDGRVLLDLYLTAEVLAVSQPSLNDLRLDASDGSTVPWALRILTSKTVREPVLTEVFNRSEPVGGIHEITFELQVPNPEHNEVLIETSGQDFRRAVAVDGSDDGKDWKPLASGFNFHLSSGDDRMISQTLHYPNSRHRFLRIQVQPDLQIKELTGNMDEFSILNTTIFRQLTDPGEMVTTSADVSDREPTRKFGSPGSRWILDLRDRVPCSRIEVDIADAEFVRDVLLEMETVNVLGQTVFVPVYTENTTWQRQRGVPAEPMELLFHEIHARRLRLTVTDFRNKPLTITSVRTKAAARQIVFEEPEVNKWPLKLYFGNPDAEEPHYDFARNLEDSLDPKPVRTELTAAERNPNFLPPPAPFTERFPWLIYATLAVVSLVLGAVILNLSRAAIARHDAEHAVQKSESDVANGRQPNSGLTDNSAK